MRHAGLLASESVIFKALVIGVLVTFNLPELEVPGLALVPPDRRWRGRKVAGTYHVPSAKFNRVHLSPWLTALSRRSTAPPPARPIVPHRSGGLSLADGELLSRIQLIHKSATFADASIVL